VFIYGPPAAGKYTIAKALAEQLNWPLFHNHVVIDCVESVIAWGEPGFHDACADIRIALAAHALRNSISMVSTFVYAKGFDADDAFVARLQDTVTRANARFCAVQLIGSADTLRTRCVAPHRAAMKKIATPEKLDAVLAEFDCTSSIEGIESLVIDTDAFSVEQSVQAIRTHFALTGARG
ncbi:MAG: AAA family ATPase, partial [Casimicrobium sp.]